MPELITHTGVVTTKMNDQAQEEYAYTLPSIPTGALDNPAQEQPEPRFLLDLLHVAKKLDDLNDRIATLIDIEQAILADRIKERTFIDVLVNISQHIEYTVDYKERKYLYMFSVNSVTVNLSTGGTLSVGANTWTNISLPRGTKLTIPASSDATPTVVIVRACDVYLG